MTLKNTQYGLKGPRFVDLTGRKFDKLTVVTYDGYNPKDKISTWLCLCDCGKKVVRKANTLTRFKNYHSCGCTGTRPVLPNNQHAFKRMYHTYKNNAKKRGYNFNLSTNIFRKLISSNCYYCGIEPKVRFENCTVDPILANGVDRKNNDKDYSVKNCVSCCKVCNIAKSEMTIEQFLDWVEKVYYYNKRNF